MLTIVKTMLGYEIRLNGQYRAFYFRQGSAILAIKVLGGF